MFFSVNRTSNRALTCVLSNGLGKMPPKLAKSGERGLNREDAVLIVLLQVGEEEQAVLEDRPSSVETPLPTSKERFRVLGLASQRRVGGEVVVAK